MDEEYIDPGVQMDAADPVEQVNEAPQEQSVPLSALQSERAHRQQLQQEMDMIRNHLALMQSNQQQPREEYDPNDIMTQGEFDKRLSAKEKQFNSQLAELHMARKYPDYEDVVTKYLPEAIKENPRIRDVLESTNDYELAYYLSKKSDAYQTASKKSTKHADAERILKNAATGSSLASVGSNSPISQAKNYKSMSDDDFKALVNQNMGQF